MGFSISLRKIESNIKKELRATKRKVDASAAKALNASGKRANEFLRAGAKSALKIERATAVNRQIRIPQKLRASQGKLRVVGVYGAYVPAIRGGVGEGRIFDQGRPVVLPGTSGRLFLATMKSGHTGWFVRMGREHPQHKIVRRPRSVNKWGRSELPIKEIFTNETSSLTPIAVRAVDGQNEYFLEVFNNELRARFRRGL